MINKPKRVILNFNHKCALNCEWCYVSFGSSIPKESVVERIINKLSNLGFKILTIGGGDPFQYSFIWNIIEKAKSNGLYIHIDTNGRLQNRSEREFSIIRDKVDLIGFPIDGPTALIHGGMRSSQGHFDIILKNIEWLNPIINKIKINTLISKENIQTLPDLSHFINTISPKRWCIYQYMPIGPGARVAQKYLVSSLDFKEATIPIINQLSNSDIVVEINDSESRKRTYPIVDHNGFVYIHDKSINDNLKNIGSLFENNIMEKICIHCGSDRETAVSRYI